MYLVIHPNHNDDLFLDRTLYCNRNSIHKNLCAALLLHVISLLVILSPRITGDETIYGEVRLFLTNSPIPFHPTHILTNNFPCLIGVAVQKFHVPVFLCGTRQYYVDLCRRIIPVSTTDPGSLQERSAFQTLLLHRLGYVLLQHFDRLGGTTKEYLAGFPLVLAIAWALATEYAPEDVQYSAAGDIVKAPPNKCWSEYSKQPYHWIITGPCLVALVVSVCVNQQTRINSLMVLHEPLFEGDTVAKGFAVQLLAVWCLQVNLMFLIMIIIVLVTKLRANNAVETVQVRKAIKATFILVPLLGISNLLFVANPNDNGFGEKVGHDAPTFLTS